MARVEGVQEYPKNWEEIKEKYLTRENEAKQNVMKRRGVSTEDELIGKSKQVVIEHLELRSGQRAPVEKEVLTEAKSKHVYDQKNTLSDEIKNLNKVAVDVLGQLPAAAKPLAGRVTSGRAAY